LVRSGDPSGLAWVNCGRHVGRVSRRRASKPPVLVGDDTPSHVRVRLVDHPISPALRLDGPHRVPVDPCRHLLMRKLTALRCRTHTPRRRASSCPRCSRSGRTPPGGRLAPGRAHRARARRSRRPPGARRRVPWSIAGLAAGVLASGTSVPLTSTTVEPDRGTAWDGQAGRPRRPRSAMRLIESVHLTAKRGGLAWSTASKPAATSYCVRGQLDQK